MIKLRTLCFSFVALLACQAHSGVLLIEESETLLSYVFQSKGKCSGGLIDSAMEGSPESLTLISAAHCPRSWPSAVKVNAFINAVTTARDLLKVFSVEPKVDAAHWLVTEPAKFRSHKTRDIAYYPLSSKVTSLLRPYTNRLALGLPDIGRQVHWIGYPKGRGPVKVDCRYNGPTVGLVDSFDRPMLLFRADCGDIGPYGAIEGASGALVYNEQNEVIGVLSGQSKTKGRGGDISFSILNASDLNEAGNIADSLAEKPGRKVLSSLSAKGELMQFETVFDDQGKLVQARELYFDGQVREYSLSAHDHK